MPYLRLFAPELHIDVKRKIVRELTDSVVQNVSGMRPDWIAIQFFPFKLDDFALGGELMDRRRDPDYHLDITALHITSSQRRGLAEELTDILAHHLYLTVHEKHKIHVEFHEYKEGDFAVGGKLLTEAGAARAVALAPAGLLLGIALLLWRGTE